MGKHEVSDAESNGSISPGAKLRGLITRPDATLVFVSLRATALATLQHRFNDEPATLVRTKAGRSLSRRRYHTAERAFLGIQAGFHDGRIRTTLHEAGAVAKLALCGHLLDVGFPDHWLAKHIKQDISKALAYANATGLGHECPDLLRLALILTPYWKWGYPQLIGDPPMDTGGFTTDQVRTLMRALLERVHDVTGHTRPRGWQRMQEFRP